MHQDLTYFKMLSLGTEELMKTEITVSGYPVEKVSGFAGYSVWSQSGHGETLN